jgi:hypothetical protein
MISLSLMLMLHDNSGGQRELTLMECNCPSWICGRGKIQIVDNLPVNDIRENVLPTRYAFYGRKTK